MGGRFGGEWIHVYVWLGPETIIALIIVYTPTQNKKFIKKTINLNKISYIK